MLSAKNRGIIGSVLVHAVLLALLLLLGFTTPLPLPAEMGILVNFGNSDEGMGMEEPLVQEAAPQTATAAPAEAQPADDAPLTQDFEEAAALPPKKKEQPKPKEKPVEKPKETTKPAEEKPKQEVVEEKPRESNPKALFPGKKTDGTTTSGEGVTGTAGNQGKPDGSVDSNNREGGPVGGGTGDGISFSLGGRQASNLPLPNYPKQKSGSVVVQVTVDKQGNVTKAVPGVKGSTTLDSDLLKAAENAALKAKFDVSTTAPAYQTGTITYVFRLK